MTLPRTTGTKKFSHNSTTDSATRQGSKKLRKQVDEDYEEMEDFEDAEAIDIEDDGQEEEPQAASVQELMSNMVDAQRKRHTAKKQAVIRSFDVATTTVQNSINTLFDEHEENVSGAHEAQLQRLQELLARKASLERDMEAKLTTLRGGYDAHSRDIETVLNRRIKELK